MRCKACGKAVNQWSSSCSICGATLPDSDCFASPNGPAEVRRRFGRKPQVAGGIAMLMGVGFVASLSPQTGNPVDLHKLAYAFILIGVFLLAAGTLARWYYLP
jgi:hypothetical protein